MKVTIHYSTDDTIRHMDSLDESITRAAEMHGGHREAGGLGPEGRELVFDGFAGAKDIQRFIKQTNSVVAMFINRYPGLKLYAQTNKE